MCRNNYRLLHLFLFCFAFALLFFPSAAPQITKEAYSPSPYSEAVELFTGEKCYNALSFFKNTTPFSLMGRGHTVCCLDVQAASALASGITRHFLPECLLTPVFVTDSDRTDFIPESWKDLLNSPVKVSFPDRESPVLRRAAFASAVSALHGKKEATEFLKKLFDSGIMDYGVSSAPIRILFDSWAVNEKKNGRNLHISVPSDGTLSFFMGRCSTFPSTPLPAEILIEAGLRLPDGRCDPTLYPPPSAYGAARRVRDMRKFTSISADVNRILRRRVLRERTFSPVDNLELMLALGITLILFTFEALHGIYRVFRSDVRIWIRGISTLCALWLVLHTVKYHLHTDVATRTCWYLYYVFLLALPLTLLYISIVIDHPDRKRKLPFFFTCVAAFFPILLLLVFTNDFHEIVFSLHYDSMGEWNGNYSYRIGYVIIYLYCALTFSAAIFLLIRKNRKSPKQLANVLPIFLAVLLISFTLGYALQVKICREMNFSLVFCILVMLFLESVLRAGLIPVNSLYRELFFYAPLNMQLLDEKGKTRLAASGAGAISRGRRRFIIHHPGTVFTKNKNILLHSEKITGGVAVWQEDISHINSLRRRILASTGRTRKINTFLRHRLEIHKKQTATAVRKKLFSLLSDDIAKKRRLLADVVRTLQDNRGDRKLLLCLVTLLLCSIKRQCNLFFIGREKQTMPGEQLVMYLYELCDFAKYSDIHTLIRCGRLETVPVKYAGLCYDFYFSLLYTAVRYSDCTLIAGLEKSGDKLCFSALTSFPSGMELFSEEFTDSMENIKAQLSFRTLDDALSITLVFDRWEDS